MRRDDEEPDRMTMPARERVSVLDFFMRFLDDNFFVCFDFFNARALSSR